MKTAQLRRIIAQANYNRRQGVSPQQQLLVLDSRPGQAKRERARLQKQIDAETPKPAKKVRKENRS